MKQQKLAIFLLICIFSLVLYYLFEVNTFSDIQSKQVSLKQMKQIKNKVNSNKVTQSITFGKESVEKSTETEKADIVRKQMKPLEELRQEFEELSPERLTNLADDEVIQITENEDGTTSMKVVKRTMCPEDNGLFIRDYRRELMDEGLRESLARETSTSEN